MSEPVDHVANATKLLSDPQWMPTRAHYEELRNALGRTQEKLAALETGDLAKAYLIEAGSNYAKGGFEMVFRTPIGALIFEFFTELLKSANAPNFIALDAQHHELGRLEMTVQKVAPDADTPQAKLARMRAALQNAAGVFRHYANLHANKGTPEGDEKAAVNNREAELCEAALATKGGVG